MCIGPNEAAERVVRAGKRLADALNAEWIVVFVETPDLSRYHVDMLERFWRRAWRRGRVDAKRTAAGTAC